MSFGNKEKEDFRNQDQYLVEMGPSKELKRKKKEILQMSLEIN